MTQDRHYLLGHSEHELGRLDLQGALYREMTTRAFRDGGIREGMRVLDIGCGSGDVSLTVAEIVGASGLVLGVDRGSDAIAAARVNAKPLSHVAFEVAELGAFEQLGHFDALVGRFILMHQPEPAQLLEHLLRSVRPGGCVVLLESWMELLRTGGHSEPFSPLYEEVVQWSCEVVRCAGADLHAGGRLRSVFVEAGLPDPTTRLEAHVAGEHDPVYYDFTEQSVQSMLPEARRLGLDGFDDASSRGLGRRLQDEVTRAKGSLLAWPVVAAWSRTQGEADRA